MECIDAHVHCGREFETFEDYFRLKDERIKGAVMFSHVAEIYDRQNVNFQDNEKWQQKRKKANKYVLSLSKNKNFKVFPFFFVWNDFPIEQLSLYSGVKWHRHWNEPKYNYDSEKCRRFIEEVRKRDLPVILEEEFSNTMKFINELARGIMIIIPHLGLLNGGYERFRQEGIFGRENIYVDTALANQKDIKDCIKHYGTERIIFGSDFPFGSPKEELEKILELNISEEAKKAIISLNILRLLKRPKANKF